MINGKRQITLSCIQSLGLDLVRSTQLLHPPDLKAGSAVPPQTLLQSSLHCTCTSRCTCTFQQGNLYPLPPYEPIKDSFFHFQPHDEPPR